MAEPFKNDKTGKWEFVFDYYVLGKRKQIRRRGFSSKREATDKMAELRKKVKDKDYIQPNNITLKEFMEKWFENERRLQIGEHKQRVEFSYMKNHTLPMIGHIKLQELNPQDCQDFVSELFTKKNLSRSTVENIVTTLKLALDRAKVYRYIEENFARTIQLPRKEEIEMKVWDLKQVNYFLDYTKNKRFFCAYALALLTGMRQGEILGLRWSDIDLESKKITINQVRECQSGKLRVGAKTKAGRRTISISDQMRKILKLHRQKYYELKKKKGDKFEDIDIVIFNRINGKTVFRESLGHAYRKDVKESGLPYIRFHDLRHTHSTLLIASKVNPKVISERLGHAKVRTTLEVYSHVLPSMQEEVAQKLEEIISVDL